MDTRASAEVARIGETGVGNGRAHGAPASAPHGVPYTCPPAERLSRSIWPSRTMRSVTHVLASEPKLMADAEAFREAHEGREYPKPPPVTAGLRIAATTTCRDVDGFPVYTVTPKLPQRMRPGRRSDWHIMYLHGGGYCDQLLSLHWEIVLNLIRYTGATVTVPLYPLAPEHTHEQGNALVERVYRGLLDKVSADRVVLMGDSAGGGMCLTQAMRYRDAGLPQPARLILFAPWVTVLTTNPEMAAVEPYDPVLARPGMAVAARWWAGSDDLTHPQISPLFADVKGLPPADFYSGTADLLTPDVRLMVEKICAAGGRAEMVEYPDAIHVYVGASFTPEAQTTYRRVARTLETSNVQVPLRTRFVTSPTALIARGVIFRVGDGDTPWIGHMGVRERWQLIRQAARTPAGSQTEAEPHQP